MTRFRDALQPVVLRWVQTWFGDAEYEIAQEDAGGSACRSKADPYPLGALLAIDGVRASHSIGEFLLGSRARTESAGSKTRALMERLGQRALDDLCVVLGEFADEKTSSPGAAASQPGHAAYVAAVHATRHDDVEPWRFTLRVDGWHVTTLCVGRAALASWMPPVEALPNAKPLRSRTEAMSPQVVRARVYLGEVSLPVADLKDLAVGDVLVLGRLLEDRVDIRLSGKDTNILTGALCAADGEIAVQLATRDGGSTNARTL
ncbi:FliM/FliN family flagellar motor C-terminal domain-containing protein [Cupriavidus basilensis]|uniref:FliM/FliN family flagellar motor C-terminal domain-containing protein n=1 Tax=Cupriavidus basilensis TaxID=68895 RepID=A0ABT6AW14_9BURK|nr:FliM/FliN family flagellar motor C-terminal domain-containing protein [Cupriavidus basilensis]MDF3836821.1 FliM/FliN family flagellar motor C-terminal domain-containing protein [Cupriavidus basilensis]